MAGKPRKLNYDEESASIVDSVQFALRGGGGAEPPGHSAEHGGHSGAVSYTHLTLPTNDSV